MPGSHWTAFTFLRGNCSNDKLIRDNTGGVWLPRPGAGFTHLKLLSVCRVVGGWVGSFLFYCLPNPDFQVLIFSVWGLMHSTISLFADPVCVLIYCSSKMLRTCFSPVLLRWVVPDLQIICYGQSKCWQKTRVSYLPFSLVCQEFVFPDTSQPVDWGRVMSRS